VSETPSTQPTKKKQKKRPDRRAADESFTTTEIRKLLEVCDNLMDEVIIYLGIHLGLRRQDMVRIKIASIDFNNHLVHYYEEKKDRHRALPLAPKLEQLLKKYVNTRRGEEWLFPYGKSKWGDRSLWNRLNRLCDKAGIRRREFHALRATCVKLLRKQGWKDIEIAEILGDNIDVMRYHYGAPNIEDLKELMNRTRIIKDDDFI